MNYFNRRLFLISFLIIIGAFWFNMASAATLYWVGNAGANASVAGNWKTTDPAGCGSGDGSAAPGASDTAVFDPDCDNSASFNITSVGAIDMQAGYAGTVSATSTLAVGGNMTVSAGTFQTAQNADGSVNITGTLLVDTNGTFVVRYKSLTVPDTGGAGQTITAGTLTINGNMNADGQGFAAGAGPGAPSSSGEGGSYGGRGGEWYPNTGVAGTYGSITNPTSLGSGGYVSGATGGGAIIISSSGTVTISGTLSSNGIGTDTAGSGGSINITANTLTGAGTISANGGSVSAGSGGGGGRIGLAGVTTFTFSGTLQANNGTGNFNYNGYSGTIAFSSGYNLTLGAGNMASLRLGTDDTATAYTFGTITIQDGGTLEIDGNPSLNSGNGGASVLNVTTLDIQSGGTLSANGLGFRRRYGPGGSLSYGGTGSYGGEGYATGGTTYGSITNPTSLGSGGYNGNGGGAIIISSSGTVNVGGTLSASGADSGDGAGSGGTINISATTLTGLGTISANGVGNWRGTGGGRISITQTAGTTWTPTIQAFGGDTTSDGAAGTVYLKDANDAAGDGQLTIDNNSVATVSGTDTLISSSVTDAAVGDVVIQNAGKLQMASSTTLTVSGNWTNNGTATLTAGTVTLDGVNQTLTGTTTFYNLTKTDSSNNSSSPTLTISAGSTQTISNTLTLTGLDKSDMVNIRSSTLGTKFTLSVGGAQSVSWLSVRDAQASGSSITCSSCMNFGNNDDLEDAPHWIFSNPVNMFRAWILGKTKWLGKTLFKY